MTKHEERRPGLTVQIHTEGCTLTAAQRQRIEGVFHGLRRIAAKFPVDQLHLHVHEYPRQGGFHVKANLELPKTRLFTGERGEALKSTCEECADQLVRKLEAYQDKLSNRHDWPGVHRGEVP